MADMTGKSGRGTARQTVRLDETLWETFAAATAAVGADRSTVLRDFVRWYVRERGAKLPKRPTTQEDRAS